MHEKNWKCFPNHQQDDLPLLITEEKEQVALALHSHTFVELIIVMEGTGTHLSRFAPARIQRGDVLVIPSGGKHGYAEVSQLHLYNILFDPTMLPMPRLDLHALTSYQGLFLLQEDFFSARNPYPQFKLSETALATAERHIHDIRRENQLKHPGYRFMQMGAFMLLMGHLCRNCSNSAMAVNSVPFQVAQAIQHLNVNYRSDCRISRLARRIGMSQSALQRNFERATGLPPLQYLLRIRLEHACNLLDSTAESISHVAQACGFKDLNYFTRCFRKFNGMPPTQWRLRHNAPDKGTT